MQTTSDLFTAHATGSVRPLSWQLRAAFDKTFDDDIEFFELDTSLLDGPHILSPSDNNVVAQWDKYVYEDYSDRVIQIEWSREEEVPYSVTQAIADFTLNNYDNYFTRGSSPLDPNILPRRPVRILAGFGGMTVPQFVGLTESVPKVDRKTRTASVHCLDFLSFLFDKSLDQTVILENQRTDEVLDYLFQLAGLLPSQYVLEEGFNEIAFVYFERGQKMGDAIRKIMQAELGTLYMDELGVIRFRNRVKQSGASVYSFDSTNIIDYKLSDESKIINVVEINSSVREVQAMGEVYNSTAVEELPVGSSEIFFNFNDPVTSLDPITDYTANTLADGTGADVTGDINVTDTDLFATAVKVTFDNTSGSQAYLTSIIIDGTAATVVREINYREQDDVSVAEFEEQVLTIENNFIQDNDAADSLGLSILNYYKDYANTIEINVKGNPALQIGDNIDVTIDDIDETYAIFKITNILQQGQFRQQIVGKIYDIPAFFIISDDSTDMSELDGADVLSP